MATHSTIRNVVNALTVSLFAACLSAVLSLSAEATGVNHQQTVVTKHVDTATASNRGLAAGWDLKQNKKAARTVNSLTEVDTSKKRYCTHVESAQEAIRYKLKEA